MITRTEIEALIATFENTRSDEACEELWDTINAHLGSGKPANADFADALGPDYLFALNDGTIVAAGADQALRFGTVDREIRFYSPAEQK